MGATNLLLARLFQARERRREITMVLKLFLKSTMVNSLIGRRYGYYFCLKQSEYWHFDLFKAFVYNGSTQ